MRKGRDRKGMLKGGDGVVEVRVKTLVFLVLALMLALSFGILIAAISSSNYQITRYGVTGGAENVSSETYGANVTAGESGVGNISSGSYNILVGFPNILSQTYEFVRKPSACTDSDGDCDYTNINADDNTYEDVNLKTDPYGWLNVTDWDSDIPAGYAVVSATLYVNWTNSSTPKTGNVYVEYINGGGGWSTCGGPIDGCHQAECQTSCDLSSLPASTINPLIVRFRGEDLDLLLPALGQIDYIYMKITYTDAPPEWRLQQTNDSDNKISDNATINLSAEGYDYFGLSYAWLETNESGGTWINYTGDYGGNYGSPKNLGDVADTWTQTNFTWQNNSVSGAYVGWRIWYNDTTGNLNVTDTGVFSVGVVAAGNLSVSLDYPTVHLDVVQNDTFWVNTTVTCVDADCGNVYGVLRYNASGAEPDTNVSTTSGDKPFWTSSGNAQSCGNMNQNDICMKNWSVNATGWFRTDYALDVNFSSGSVSNDTDNAEITIINSYQMYYGNATGNITLSISSGEQMIRFSVLSAAGVVFITDTDSSISWADLVEIGKDTGGSNSSSDFEEIDTVLNITGKPDSLNASYSTDGSKAKLTESFIVFNKTLSYTPVASNIGNSSFKTGIMWDSSDDVGGDSEFDSTDEEDLVFAVKMSESASCYGGDCDYEIKVPYALKSYKSGTDTVSFYVEFL